MTEVDRRSYEFSDNEWANAKSVLKLLEAMSQVTTTLSGESTLYYVCWCLPLLFGFCEAAKPDKNDSSTFSVLKQNKINLDECFKLMKLKMELPMVMFVYESINFHFYAMKNNMRCREF